LAVWDKHSWVGLQVLAWITCAFVVSCQDSYLLGGPQVSWFISALHDPSSTFWLTLSSFIRWQRVPGVQEQRLPTLSLQHSAGQNKSDGHPRVQEKGNRLYPLIGRATKWICNLPRGR
jgi:hypothetical protein